MKTHPPAYNNTYPLVSAERNRESIAGTPKPLLQASFGVVIATVTYNACSQNQTYAGPETCRTNGGHERQGLAGSLT